MNMTEIPFGTTDWSAVERTEHKGDSGKAYWRTRNFGKIRVRMVEYTAGYLADHWCSKGHILFCVEGELETTEALAREVLSLPLYPELGDAGVDRVCAAIERAVG